MLYTQWVAGCGYDESRDDAAAGGASRACRGALSPSNHAAQPAGVAWLAGCSARAQRKERHVHADEGPQQAPAKLLCGMEVLPHRRPQGIAVLGGPF